MDRHQQVAKALQTRIFHMNLENHECGSIYAFKNRITKKCCNKFLTVNIKNFIEISLSNENQ